MKKTKFEDLNKKTKDANEKNKKDLRWEKRRSLKGIIIKERWK